MLPFVNTADPLGSLHWIWADCVMPLADFSATQERMCPLPAVGAPVLDGLINTVTGTGGTKLNANERCTLQLQRNKPTTVCGKAGADSGIVKGGGGGGGGGSVEVSSKKGGVQLLSTAEQFLLQIKGGGGGQIRTP